MLSNLKGFEGLRTYLHRSLRMISSCMQLQNLIGFHWVAAAMPSSQIYPSRSGYFDLLMDRTTRSRHASSNTRLVLSTSNSSLIPSPLNIKFEQQLVPRSAGNFKLQMDSSLRAGSTKLMSSQRLARSWSAAASANLSQVCRLNSILCRFQVKHLRSQTPRPPLLAKRDADGSTVMEVWK